MALKSLSLALIVLLCLFIPLLLSSADGLSNEEKSLSSVSSLKDFRNRKLGELGGLKATRAAFKIHDDTKKENRNEEDNHWELRAAPLGPDPLHHNGAKPKKPQTP